MVTITSDELDEILKRQTGVRLPKKPVACYPVAQEKRVAKGRIPGSEMNKTEQEFSEILSRRNREGEIVWWKYEAITLVLKDFGQESQSVRYTPDFCIMLASGEIQFIETKGPYVREDSWQKLKIAASLFPFKFTLAQRDKNHQWHYKEA